MATATPLARLQEAVELIVQLPDELQQQAAEVLSQLPSSRSSRWSALACCRQPGRADAEAAPFGSTGLLAGSSQLRRALQGVGRQTAEWQQAAAEKLLDLVLAARLQALPPELQARVARCAGRTTRRASRALLRSYGALDCGLRLEDAASLLDIIEASHLGPSMARLGGVTALELGPLPGRSATHWLQAGPLQDLVLRVPRRLQALTLLRGAEVTPEFLAALGPLSSSLQALQMPCSLHQPVDLSLRGLASLRSLTLTPTTPPPPGQPAPGAGQGVVPQLMAEALRRLPHLQYLDLDLYPQDAPTDPQHEQQQPPASVLFANAEWLPCLAALGRLTHISLHRWMLHWDDAAVRLLRAAWPALVSLALELDLPPTAPAGLRAGIAAALAARTALTSLHLHLPSPCATDLSALSSLALRRAVLRQPAEDAWGTLLLQAVAAQKSLTQLHVAVPLRTAACAPPLLSLAGSLAALAVRVQSCALGSTLACAAQLPRLRTLALHLVGRPEDRQTNAWAGVVGTLSQLTRLRALRLLDDCHLPGCVVRPIASLTALQELGLVALKRGTRDTPRMSDAHLRPLAALQALSRLEVHGQASFRGKGLTVLRQLGALQALQLEGMPEVELFCRRLDAYLLPLPAALRRVRLQGVALSVEAQQALLAAAARQDCTIVFEQCWLP